MMYESTQKYLMSELRKALELSEAINKEASKFQDAIQEIRPGFSFEDFEFLNNDLNKNIHIPLWNDLNERTPDEMESYNNNDFLIWSEPDIAVQAIWNDKSKSFCVYNAENKDWEKVKGIRYWIPICPPSLY